MNSPESREQPEAGAARPEDGPEQAWQAEDQAEHPEVPDLLAWVIAFSPLPGLAAGYFMPENGRLVYLLVLLGVVYFDSFVIQRSGREIQGWANLIPPYYLYKRYKVLNDEPQYFRVGVLLFAALFYLWFFVF